VPLPPGGKEYPASKITLHATSTEKPIAAVNLLILCDGIKHSPSFQK